MRLKHFCNLFLNKTVTPTRLIFFILYLSLEGNNIIFYLRELGLRKYPPTKSVTSLLSLLSTICRTTVTGYPQNTEIFMYSVIVPEYVFAYMMVNCPHHLKMFNLHPVYYKSAFCACQRLFSRWERFINYLEAVF